VVAEEASVDSDERADEAWLLSVQRKLYQWSRNNPDTCYRELWNWVTDRRNLRCAWRKIASNKGSRTAGIDGMTVERIQAGQGSEAFLIELRGPPEVGPVSAEPVPTEVGPQATPTREVPTPGHPHRHRPRRARRG
jgi:RNA-directed DNA polymerase